MGMRILAQKSAIANFRIVCSLLCGHGAYGRIYEKSIHMHYAHIKLTNVTTVRIACSDTSVLVPTRCNHPARFASKMMIARNPHVVSMIACLTAIIHTCDLLATTLAAL